MNEQLLTAKEQTKILTVPLQCQYTGIILGSITVQNIAGHMPFLGQWKDSQTLHPIFSFPQGKLLSFAKDAWIRFCMFSPQESMDDALTERQEQILRVCTLAMLHHLTTVKQSVVWLPSFNDVTKNWTSLLQLSYWQAYLESRSFRFPSLVISKTNKDIDLHSFLQLCWDIKKSYEKDVREIEEEAKLKKAEQLAIAIRGEIAGKRPVSTKLLYNWFLANLPARYRKDGLTWMKELFFSKTLSELEEFTIADIDLFEEIFLCEIPTGTSLSHAFLQQLNDKRKILTERFDTFEILIPSIVMQEKEAGNIPIEEPQLKDFPSKAAFLIAQAKWRLAHTDISKHARAALEKQKELTVSPSFIPTLGIGKSTTDILETAAQQLEIQSTDLDEIPIDHDDSDLDISGEFEE